MEAALLIMLREGFEAALVVAIVLTYLYRVGRGDLARGVWLGVGLASVVAFAFGIVMDATVGSFEGDARMRANAAIAITAAGVLTWMVFWMQRQSRGIKGDLEHQVDRALRRDGALTGLVAVAFVSVLREGIEAALFLVAAATDTDGRDVLVGGLIGLALAIGLGAAIFVGGRRIPMKVFFTVTGMIVIVFAAGLLAKAVMFLQAQGSADVGSLNLAFFDVTNEHFLTTSNEFGRALAALIGWDPRPSIEQVVVWLAYLVPVSVLFLRGPRVGSASDGHTRIPVRTAAGAGTVGGAERRDAPS